MALARAKPPRRGKRITSNNTRTGRNSEKVELYKKVSALVVAALCIGATGAVDCVSRPQFRARSAICHCALPTSRFCGCWTGRCRHDGEQVDLAANLLSKASQIAIFGLGASAIVGMDLQ